MDSSSCKRNEPMQPHCSSLGDNSNCNTTRRLQQSPRPAIERGTPTKERFDYGRRRRKRQSSVWRTQQQQYSCLLLLAVVLLSDRKFDVSGIATAFPLHHTTKSLHSLPPTTVSSFHRRKTFRTRQFLPLPELSEGRTREQHALLFFASAPSASLDGDGADEASAPSNTTFTNNNNNNSSTPEQTQYQWTSQTLALALPALIGMLVDPLLSMMDTAYVGNLGSSTELAALGACTSIFHLAFNAFRATTAATTSLVGNASSKKEKQSIVQISLSLGLVMGIGVGAFLRGLGPWCLACMGVKASGPLFAPGLSYLQTRSLAAPAVLAITVAEGAFRGYGDTTIPLLASGIAAVVNLVLDPLLMLPPLSWGVRGAAAATAASQVGALFVYLWFLKKRTMLPSKRSSKDDPSDVDANQQTSMGGVIKTILGANLAMVCKQGSLLLAWAYATAKATRIGQAHVAAHQVALSCWLVFALLQDGAGVASQVLLTKVVSGSDDGGEDNDDGKTTEQTTNSSNRHNKLVSLVRYMLRLSVLQGLVVTGGFWLVTPYLPGWFVPDDALVRGHLSKLLPHVAGQQLLVSLTLVLESLAVGGKQFRLLAVGTALSTIFSVVQIQKATTVVGVWSRGIVGLFAGRLVTAVIGTVRVLVQSKNRQADKSPSGR